MKISITFLKINIGEKWKPFKIKKCIRYDIDQKVIDNGQMTGQIRLFELPFPNDCLLKDFSADFPKEDRKLKQHLMYIEKDDQS
jgi:hypothetical protein